jgi:hypothetical protein
VFSADGSNVMVSLSNHGNARAAVLRQAHDVGGVRGEVFSNTMVSLSNHGWGCAAVLRQAQDDLERAVMETPLGHVTVSRTCSRVTAPC